MENASKALIMAGGILIAIIIIGLLLVMVSQVGKYQNTQDSTVKDSQLAAFNLDFERYTDDKGILGTDIISLVNKVVDYNAKVQKEGVNNSVNYNIKMSIEVKGFDKFNEKYAYDSSSSNKIFKSKSYKIGFGQSNQILTEFKDYERLEKSTTPDIAKMLSSMYDAKNRDASVAKMKKYLSEWKKTYDVDRNLDVIEKYKQYSEFKSSKFKVFQQPKYQDGQIQELYFEFDK